MRLWVFEQHAGFPNKKVTTVSLKSINLLLTLTRYDFFTSSELYLIAFFNLFFHHVNFYSNKTIKVSWFITPVFTKYVTSGASDPGAINFMVTVSLNGHTKISSHSPESSTTETDMYLFPSLLMEFRLA